MSNSKKTYYIAVATTDNIVVNQHFGKADTFQIFEVEEDKSVQWKECRNIIPVCQGGFHDDNTLQETVKIFMDCRYVLVSRIGPGASSVLESAGIHPVEIPGYIKDSLHKVIAYDQMVQANFDKI